MSERTEALAARLEAANREAVAAVERCSPAAWQATCAAEGWTVAATARHIADQFPPLSRWVAAIATNEPLPPISRAAIDEANARNAERFANCDRHETAALLRENGARAVGLIRGLTDEQLDHTAQIAGRPMTAQQVIENVLIGHVQGHLRGILAATGG
jgi:uncharacterized damage-inducible protein DinB